MPSYDEDDPFSGSFISRDSEEEEYRFYESFIDRYGAALEAASEDYDLLVEAPGAQGEFESALFSAVTIASSEGVYIDDDTLESVLTYLGRGELGEYARQCAEKIRANQATTH